MGNIESSGSISNGPTDWLGLLNDCKELIEENKIESLKSKIEPSFLSSDIKQSLKEDSGRNGYDLDVKDLCDVYLNLSGNLASQCAHHIASEFVTNMAAEINPIHNRHWKMRRYIALKIEENIQAHIETNRRGTCPMNENCTNEPSPLKEVDFLWTSAISDLADLSVDPQIHSLQFLVATSITLSCAGVMGLPRDHRNKSIEYMSNSLIGLFASLASTKIRDTRDDRFVPISFYSYVLFQNSSSDFETSDHSIRMPDQKSDKKIHSTYPETYTITGATGPNGAIINGTYERTAEYTGNIPTYQQQEDQKVWLLYYFETKSWFVQTTVNKYSNKANAHVSARLPDEEGAVWKVSMASTYADQPQMKVVGKSSLHSSSGSGKPSISSTSTRTVQKVPYSMFTVLSPSDPICNAMEQLEQLVKDQLYHSSSTLSYTLTNPSSEPLCPPSEPLCSPTVRSAAVSLLFAIAVVRQSLRSMLNVVDILITSSGEVTLLPSVNIFWQAINCTDAPIDPPSLGSATECAQAILRALQELTKSHRFLVQDCDDCEALVGLIERHSRTARSHDGPSFNPALGNAGVTNDDKVALRMAGAPLTDMCACAQRILCENIQLQQDRLSMVERRDILTSSLRSRLLTLLNSIIDDASGDPAIDRDVYEAVKLIAGVKDVLIPDGTAQFDIIKGALNAPSGTISRARQQLAILMMEEMKSTNLIDLLLQASGDDLSDTLLTNLNRLLEVRIHECGSGAVTAPTDNEFWLENQTAMAKAFSRVSLLSIGIMFQTIKSSEDKFIVGQQVNKIIDFTARLLMSVKSLLFKIDDIASIDDKSSHMAACLLLSQSHLATFSPIATFVLHLVFRYVISVGKIESSMILRIKSILADFVTYQDTDLDTATTSFSAALLDRESSEHDCDPTSPNPAAQHDSSHTGIVGGAASSATATASPRGSSTPRSARSDRSARSALSPRMRNSASIGWPQFDQDFKSSSISVDEDGATATMGGEQIHTSPAAGDEFTPELEGSFVYCGIEYVLPTGQITTGNYVEFEIITSNDLDIAIGFASKLSFPHDGSTRLGSKPFAYGYYGDDGRRLATGDAGKDNITGSVDANVQAAATEDRVGPAASWPSWAVGDTIGCGIDFTKKAIFYTRNGSLLGFGFLSITEEALSPVIYFGPSVTSCRVRVNFGSSAFKYDGVPVAPFPFKASRQKNSNEKASFEWFHRIHKEILGIRLLLASRLISHNYGLETASTAVSGDTTSPVPEINAGIGSLTVWLESPLLGRGLTELPATATAVVPPLAVADQGAIVEDKGAVTKDTGASVLALLATEPTRPECVSFLQLMRKSVPEIRTGGEVKLNYALTAVCAALSWHHGLAPETAALMDGRKDKPSATMVAVWKAGQSLRALIDARDAPAPVGEISDLVSARAQCLLRFAPVFKDAALESTRKKLWQAAAKLAVPKASESTAVDLSSVSDILSTQKWLHETIRLRSDAAKQAKENKNPTLSESILSFVRSGPDPEPLLTEILEREKRLQDRVHGLQEVLNLLEFSPSDAQKPRILSIVLQAFQSISSSHASNFHYLNGLHGACAESMGLVEASWKRVAQLLVGGCRVALGSVGATSTATGSGTGTGTASPELEFLISSLSLLAQDYRVSDAVMIKECEIIGLLTETIKCAHPLVRRMAYKLTESILYRCCAGDSGSSSSKLTRSQPAALVSPSHSGQYSAPPRTELVSEAAILSTSSEAADLLLPGLLSVLTSQLSQAAAHNTVESLPALIGPESTSTPGHSIAESGVDETFSWVLPVTVMCHPAEPGFAAPHRPVPLSHTVSMWIWRPKGTEEGTLLVKGGPLLAAGAYPPWSSIVVKLTKGCVQVIVADGSKIDGFTHCTNDAILADGWTHFAYAVDATEKKMTLFLDGKVAVEKALPSGLYAATIPQDDVSEHVFYVGQAPSAVTPLRSATAAISRVCLVNRALNAAELSPQFLMRTLFGRLSSPLSEQMSFGLDGACACPTQSLTSRNCFALMTQPKSVYTFTVGSIGEDSGSGSGSGSSSSNVGDAKTIHCLSFGLALRSSLAARSVEDKSAFVFGHSHISYGVVQSSNGSGSGVNEEFTIRSSLGKKEAHAARPLQAGDVITMTVDLEKFLLDLRIIGDGGLSVNKVIGLPAEHADPTAYVIGASVAPGQSVVAMIAGAPVAWNLGLSCIHSTDITLSPHFGRAETIKVLGSISRIARSMFEQMGHSGMERLLHHDVLQPLLRLTFLSNSSAVRLAAVQSMAILVPHSTPR